MKFEKGYSEYKAYLNIMDKSLIIFLKENNALEKFLKNLHPKRLKEKGKIIDVGSDFVWTVSPEGYDFWRKLYDKYKIEYPYE